MLKLNCKTTACKRDGGGGGGIKNFIHSNHKVRSNIDNVIQALS